MREAALVSLGPTRLARGPIAPALARTRSTRSAKNRARIAELAAAREAPIHIHLSETSQEVRTGVAAHGERPAAYSTGSGPDRADAARPRRLARPAELDLVARAGRHRGHQPAANMKLAVVPSPYPARARPGSRRLGTDGAGSNDSLDLLADLKLSRSPRSTPPPTRPRSPPRTPGRSRSRPRPPARRLPGAVGARARRRLLLLRAAAPSWRSASSPRPRLRGERRRGRHHGRRRRS